MNKVLGYMKGLLFAIFPFIHSHIANKKIEKRINSHETQETTQSLEILREEYERSLKGKDKLEDKAKTNIVAITISITLIMGATNIVNGLINDPLWIWLPFIAVLLFVGAVIYMIVAGTSAFKLLMDKNVVYYVSSNTEDVQEYYENKEGNNNYNLIRNNLINTSFKCIRNALICLFIVLTLTLLNQFDFPHHLTSTITTQFANTEIFYSNTALQTTNFSELRLPTESLIREYYDADKLKIGEPTGLIDVHNKVFVKVIRQSAGVICVVSIEPFIPWESHL